MHSPTPQRPGRLSLRTIAGWEAAGYHLVTSEPARQNALIEVYPHTGLLALFKCKERFPYKVARARAFWPGSTEFRTRRILQAFRRIRQALGRDIDQIDIALPRPNATSTRELKEIEDQLDALVCAWTAVQYLQGKTSGLGDRTAAIWVPTTSLRAGFNREDCLAHDGLHTGREI